MHPKGRAGLIVLGFFHILSAFLYFYYTKMASLVVVSPAIDCFELENIGKRFLMLEDMFLMWKYNRGYVDALPRIYVKYKDDLMTLATALLYDRSAAEDVVHDVFVMFIRSCGKLRLTKTLKGYLTTCVANDVRNKNKAGLRRRNASLEHVAPVASDSSRPDLVAIFGEQSQRLIWALRQLPYEQRKVLLLRLYSGLKFRAIAEIEGESINTIQGQYRYGLEKMRSLLNSEVKK